MKAVSLLFLFILMNFQCLSQVILPYKNPDLPIEARVRDLLIRMTPEEKFWQLFMIPGNFSPQNGVENQCH